jgi:hypothetical protein
MVNAIACHANDIVSTRLTTGCERTRIGVQAYVFDERFVLSQGRKTLNIVVLEE